jgi:hypothetical protein
MPRRPSVFPSINDVFPSSGEIDLRKEFDQIVYGDATSVPHGKLMVLRNLRRDSDNKPVACSCRQTLSRSTDPDCSYCAGEGYLWDEQWCLGFSMYTGADEGLSSRIRQIWPGQIRVDYKVFFLRYDTEIEYGDKIVEIKLDLEGNPILPYKREAIYSIQTLIKYRSDRGRVEYIGVYCREEDAIRPDVF